jgi:hypothetical protein
MAKQEATQKPGATSNAPGPHCSRTRPATGSAVLLTIVLAALLVIGLAPSMGARAFLPLDPPPDSVSFPVDARSRTGPQPPPSVDVVGLSGVSQSSVVIPDVPAYLWHHGCGPTALGMVIGYWDARGFDALVPGNAQTQTSAVNQVIASEGPASNYSDYCLPLDYYPNLLPDKSEDPVGDEHPDACLADYLHTSQSRYGMYYGVGSINDMVPGVKAYVNALGSGYTMTVGGANVKPNPDQAWNILRGEMDVGRPMVLLVDTEGNDEPDHFVTAIGYDVVNGIRRYACYHTWDTSIHWYDFAPIAKGRPWGVWGYLRFRLTLSTPTPTPTPSAPAIYTLHLPALMRALSQPTATPTLSATPSQSPSPTSTLAATPSQTPSPTPTPDLGWQVILSDGFEGTFPGPWQCYGNPGWGRTNCRQAADTYSVWPAAVGPGAVMPCTEDYPNNLNAWMIYGPFDLTGATAAEVSFQRWQRTEAGYDLFRWMASIDGQNYHGWQSSGDTGGWQVQVLDLSNVPQIGNLCGQPQVWFALSMTSDGSAGDEGVFVDSVVVRKRMGGGLPGQRSLAPPAVCPDCLPVTARAP